MNESRCGVHRMGSLMRCCGLRDSEHASARVESCIVELLVIMKNMRSMKEMTS